MLNKENKTNSIELTESQKKLLTSILLHAMEDYNTTIRKYGFHSSITKPLIELKDEVYNIFQIINNSIEDEIEKI